MKVLMVTPEVAPFVKVGGLADVVGSLPLALQAQGIETRIVCPLYGSLQERSGWKVHEEPLAVHLGPGPAFARVWETSLPGCPQCRVYFLEHDEFFARKEVYAGPWGDHADNDRRFTFLSRASIDLCRYLEWTPEVFHCHDWTTGLVPIYLNTTERDTPEGKAASLMTIHNLQFQGIFHQSLLGYAGLPEFVFRPDGLESMGYLNMLKGGIYHSTKITTVSPTYAAEIQTPALGCGLNHILRFRAADLIGVLNGIDMDAWNPRTDPKIPAHFDADDLSGKAVCKAKLQESFGLEVNPDIPVFGAVARLYGQKGLDLLAESLAEIVETMHLQIVVLGSGDHELEEAFNAAARRFPGKVGAYIGYDDARSHLIYAGADSFIMPSRFEPCGLSQMYAMRYGAPPIVRATGGLLDTVPCYREDRGDGAGFVFEEENASALYYTIGWACSTYYDRRPHFENLRQNGMRQDFSWGQSAEAYANVYDWAVKARRWQSGTGG